jgi:hypothetical protein
MNLASAGAVVIVPPSGTRSFVLRARWPLDC